ncbi:MAG: YdcF family protein, partial [Bacteroidetes bacterium]|nr:YdcF family protein [Bacteroidota bacterium]
MELNKNTKKYLKYFLLFCLLSIVFTFIINIVVSNKSKEFIYDKVKDVPPCYTALVLGAKVSQSGYPSDFLKDRMDIAIELYKNKKVKRFLLSGDHGQKNYDEVNSMKKYLLE